MVTSLPTHLVVKVLLGGLAEPGVRCNTVLTEITLGLKVGIVVLGASWSRPRGCVRGAAGARYNRVGLVLRGHLWGRVR